MFIYKMFESVQHVNVEHLHAWIYFEYIYCKLLKFE